MSINKKQTLQVNGQSLEYQWHGNPESGKPVLVLLHEGLGCIAMWRDFPERMAENTGCPVFVYSRQGYGGSTPFEQDLGVDFMHHEGEVTLPALLDAAGIERTILVGHSDGASIALIHTGQQTDDRIVGLVLLAPHLFVEPETLVGIRQAKQMFETADLARGLSRYHFEHTADTFNRWCGIWLDPQFKTWNIESSLSGIHVPLLALMGETDQYGTLAQIDTIKRVLPELTERVVIANCGHSPHLEQPEQTLKHVQRFVEQQLRKAEIT